MIAIQCDEHIKASVSDGLRARGISVYRLEDEHLKGISDPELLDHCIRNNRVLLTNDDDFLALAENKKHPGIIFITSQFSSVGEIIRVVITLADTIPESGFQNAAFFIP